MKVDDLIKDHIDNLSPEMSKAVYLAAVPRYFNPKILEIILTASNKKAISVFNTIKRFPYVQEYDSDNFVLFDEARRLSIKKLAQESKNLYVETNRKLADHYFGICQNDNLKFRREVIEAIYHLIVVDEKLGFLWFEKIFLQSLEFEQLDYCNYLLKAINEHEHEISSNEIKRWLLFYTGLLQEKLGDWESALGNYKNLEVQDGWPSDIRLYFIRKFEIIITKQVKSKSQENGNTLPSPSILTKPIEDYESVQRELERYKRLLVLILGIVLLVIGLFVIFFLPTLISWQWFISHPKKLGLQLCALLILLGTIWTVFDKDKNRKWFAFGTIIIAAFIAITQII